MNTLALFTLIVVLMATESVSAAAPDSCNSTAPCSKPHFKCDDPTKTCKCEPPFKLNADNVTCVAEPVTCSGDSECTQPHFTCDTGKKECVCEASYKLSSDSKTCEKSSAAGIISSAIFTICITILSHITTAC